MDVSVESNLSRVEADLAELRLYIPNISRKILKRITSKGKAKLRKAYRTSGLRIGKGELYKSIFSKAKDNYTAYFGLASKQHYKFIPQNYGEVLKPRKGEFLTFQDAAGNWHKVRSVRIPAHDFFRSIEAYVESQEYKADIDAVVSREVDRLFRL